MKELFIVKSTDGTVLSSHEKKREAKLARDKGKNLHVSRGKDHWRNNVPRYK